MAVGQVLRGMQRAGAEGWSHCSVTLFAAAWMGKAGVLLRVCAALCLCCTPLLERVLGRKNTTVKGFNVLNRRWGLK